MFAIPNAVQRSDLRRRVPDDNSAVLPTLTRVKCLDR
jgi:hypothetical protein